MYYPEQTKFIKNYVSRIAASAKPYDLYILLKPDCDAIQDGTRQFLDSRWDHYNKIKQVLTEKGLEFVEVGGCWSERLTESLEIINKKFCW
jgi:nicotinamide riboside kinase